jgi:hypothetical protein
VLFDLKHAPAHCRTTSGGVSSKHEHASPTLPPCFLQQVARQSSLQKFATCSAPDAIE